MFRLPQRYLQTVGRHQLETRFRYAVFISVQKSAARYDCDRSHEHKANNCKTECVLKSDVDRSVERACSGGPESTEPANTNSGTARRASRSQRRYINKLAPR